jgi:hypothetical protein
MLRCNQGVFPYALGIGFETWVWDLDVLAIDAFEILSFIKFVEVLPMQESNKPLGRQLGVVRLCSGAVL